MCYCELYKRKTFLRDFRGNGDYEPCDPEAQSIPISLNQREDSSSVLVLRAWTIPRIQEALWKQTEGRQELPGGGIGGFLCLELVKVPLVN